MGKLTFGAGIWAFGQFVDRYAGDGYGPTRSSQLQRGHLRIPTPSFDPKLKIEFAKLLLQRKY